MLILVILYLYKRQPWFTYAVTVVLGLFVLSIWFGS